MSKPNKIIITQTAGRIRQGVLSNLMLIKSFQVFFKDILCSLKQTLSVVYPLVVV